MPSTFKKIVEVTLKVVDKTGDTLDGASEKIGFIAKALRAARKVSKAFSESLNKTKFSSADEIYEEIKKVKKAYKDFSKQAGVSEEQRQQAAIKLARQVKALNKELRDSFGPTAGFKPLVGIVKSIKNIQVGLAVIKGMSVIKDITEDLMGFDDAIRSAGAVAQASAAELQAFEDAARSAGEKTASTAKQSAEALGFLAMAGFSVQESIEALPEVLSLSAAGVKSVAVAADIASNVLTGYGLKVKDLARVNDALVATSNNSNTSIRQAAQAFKEAGPVAAAAGWSIEQTAAAIGKLGDAGFQGSQGGRVLKNVIARLIDPSKKASKVIEKLGISVKNSDGSMRSLDDIVQQLNNSGADLTDNFRLFGKVAGKATPALMSIGADAIRGLTEEIENSSGITQKVAKDLEAGLGGTVRRLVSQWGEVKIAMGRAIEPKVIAFLEYVIIKFKESKEEIAKTVGMLVSFSSYFLNAAVAVAGFIAEYGRLIIILSVGITLITATAFAIGAMMTAFKAANVASFAALLQSMKFAKVKAGLDMLGLGFVALGAKVKLALIALMEFNPIAWGIVAAVAAVTTAFIIFNKTSLNAAKKQQDVADAIGDTRKEIAGQLSEVNKLRAALDENKEGSIGFLAAQQRLAEIVPGANIALDEQGRLIVKMGDDAEESKSQIDAYAKSLSKMSAGSIAEQLEAQQRALDKTREASEEYNEELERIYGQGKEEKTKEQDINLWGNKLLGIYDSGLKKQKELEKLSREGISTQTELLKNAFALGLSSEELSAELSKVGASAGIKEEVLESYKKLAGSGKEVTKSAANSAKASAAAIAQAERAAEAAAKQTEEQKKALKSLEKQQSSASKSSKEAEKRIVDSFKAIQSIKKEDVGDELAAIDTVAAARIRALENSDVDSKRYAKEESKIFNDVYRSKLRAIRNYNADSIRLLAEEAEARKQASGADTVAIDREILSKRLQVYKETEGYYKSMIDTMISEENRHLDAIKKIEDEKKGVKESADKTIRELKRRELSEFEQYADKTKEVNEKQSAAKRALAKGDFEEAKRLNDEARSLAESNIRDAQKATEAAEGATPKEIADSRGITESEAKASVSKAIAEVKEWEDLSNKILDGMAKKHSDAAEGIEKRRKSLASTLQQTQAQIQAIENQMINMAETTIKVNTSQLDAASSKLDEIQRKLNEINSTTLNIGGGSPSSNIAYVGDEPHAEGGIVGYSRVKGALSGMFNGDDTRVILGKGEGILDGKAMDYIGNDMFNAILNRQIPKEALMNAGARTTTKSVSNVTINIDGVNKRLNSAQQSGLTKFRDSL